MARHRRAPTTARKSSVAVRPPAPGAARAPARPAAVIRPGAARAGRPRRAQVPPSWWRRRPWLVALAGSGLAVLAIAAVAVLVAAQGGSSQPSTTAGTPPLLASAGEPSGATVDGIQCEAMEQVLFHIHAHLAVYVDGTARTIPQGIGIAPPRQEVQTDSGPAVVSGSCFYWLHTHTNDGIIHIESPVQRTFTLGNFFDIWGQPLSATQVGPAHGVVVAYLNGQRFSGDPRSIPLDAHAVVQLDVGQNVASQPYTFPNGL